MYKTISSLGAIAALAATATAHGLTTGVTIDGKYTGGYLLDYYYAKQNNGPIPEHIGWAAENLDSGFVEPNAFDTPDIICHKNASPEGSSDSLASVAAGGVVEFHWNTWPESHVGPVITYVAPYSGDVASVDKTTLRWTKIQANGFEDGEWAAVKLIGQNNTWPVTVPKTLAAGKYVFRHEIIALHSGGDVNGAQNYPFCLNIEVTGSGSAVPSGGVVGTELYTPESVVFSPYGDNTKYKIPGPAMWEGAGSGSAPSTPSTPTTPSPAASVSAKPSALPSAAPSGSPVVVETPTPAASSSAAPAPSTGDGDLPEQFTIETFITWLEGKAAGSASKVRRHARSFMV